MSVRIVGIAGGSGSGKTTFAAGLAATLGETVSAVLAQDSYYIDQSARFTGDGESVNFDHPSALDFPLLARHLSDLRIGCAVQVPIYDFATHTRRTECTPFPSRPVILLDGTLILSQPEIREQLDWSIFIETRETIRFERRFHRDLVERGRKPEGIRKQFDRQVKPMHDLYVEPSKTFATEIISGETSFDGRLQAWARELSGQLVRE